MSAGRARRRVVTLMDRNIFRYILRHSARSQLLILAMTLASFPFLYATLELPKLIINDALADSKPHQVLGLTFDQVSYLFLLCGIFLVLVLINGGFKYVINVYEGIVGERMLRRLRHELYARVMRFPLAHFRRVSSGEIVQMINAEVEPLGGFIGSAFALPAFQGGTLLTILAFMFVQNPIMGVAAIILYPLQIYIIPKLQALWGALHSINPAAIAVSLLSVATILLVRKFRPAWPALLIGVLAAAIVTAGLSLNVETIGSRFGAIPAEATAGLRIAPSAARSSSPASARAERRP